MNLLKAQRRVRIRWVVDVVRGIATFLEATENENGFRELSVAVVVVVVEAPPPTPLIILLPRLATLDEVW
jgi:hypothetical protein